MVLHLTSVVNKFVTIPWQIPVGLCITNYYNFVIFGSANRTLKRMNYFGTSRSEDISTPVFVPKKRKQKMVHVFNFKFSLNFK